MQKTSGRRKILLQGLSLLGLGTFLGRFAFEIPYFNTPDKTFTVRTVLKCTTSSQKIFNFTSNSENEYSSYQTNTDKYRKSKLLINRDVKQVDSQILVITDQWQSKQAYMDYRSSSDTNQFVQILDRNGYSLSEQV